ncbi:hypothetical protein RISK_006758 [Rhodopirellula islandica]|uniref:Uncharacterized protein n=1 Tax=Rhodopirellula islandica TaxID=595434 RepID=A0A0J1E6V4_RHOIS|nr:hypothetical protein RISK_006758 [Rhodopirellula islandica]
MKRKPGTSTTVEPRQLPAINAHATNLDEQANAMPPGRHPFAVDRCLFVQKNPPAGLGASAPNYQRRLLRSHPHSPRTGPASLARGGSPENVRGDPSAAPDGADVVDVA